jgi:hypothetical protein
MSRRTLSPQSEEALHLARGWGIEDGRYQTHLPFCIPDRRSRPACRPSGLIAGR